MRNCLIILAALVSVCASLALGEDEKVAPSPTPSPTPRRVLTLTDKDLPKPKPPMTELGKTANDTRALIQTPTPKATPVPEAPKTIDEKIEGHSRTIKELRQSIADNEAEAETLAKKGNALLAESEKAEYEAKKKLRRPDILTGNVYYGDYGATMNGIVKTSQGEGIVLSKKAGQLRTEGNYALERSKSLTQDAEAKKRRLKIEQADLDKAIGQKTKAKRAE